MTIRLASVWQTSPQPKRRKVIHDKSIVLERRYAKHSTDIQNELSNALKNLKKQYYNVLLCYNHVIDNDKDNKWDWKTALPNMKMLVTKQEWKDYLDKIKFDIERIETTLIPEDALLKEFYGKVNQSYVDKKVKKTLVKIGELIHILNFLKLRLFNSNKLNFRDISSINKITDDYKPTVKKSHITPIRI